MREKLIEILRVPIFPHELADPTEAVADYLLDNDVVPVVRCPDCKYSSPKHHFDIFEWVYCTKWKTEIKRNDFCSYGERRTDNG